MSAKSHMSTLRRIGQTITLILCVSMAASCRVLDTVPIMSADSESCKTALGSYFLPKSVIRFTAQQQAGQPIQLVVSDPIADADRSQIYCLDYLASAFADDTVNVIRDHNNHLGVLEKITSTNVDKTKDVTLTALDIAVMGVTGNSNVTRKLLIVKPGDATAPTILADYQIDPFDRVKLAEVNAAMAATYGYCAVIDFHTLRRTNIQSYCNNPLNAPENRLASVVGDVSPVPQPDEANRGILYRPNQTYNLVIFRRRDPQSRTPWQIFQTKRIEMPNVSPIFSVGVDRSAFVTRKTTLSFDYGVLRDITIEKPSEVLSFVEIPLRVAQAVVQIPAEIIKVRVAAIDN